MNKIIKQLCLLLILVLSVGFVSADPIVAENQAVSTGEDTPITITLMGSDGDLQELTFSIGTEPSQGVLGNIGTPDCNNEAGECTAEVTYTPNLNYNGEDSFEFAVTADGLFYAVGNVNIDVTPINDAPILGAIGNQIVNESESLTITLTATDVDGDNLVYGTDSEHGTLSGNIFTWTPTYTEAEEYTVKFNVSDNTATVEEIITITVNDVAQIAGVTTSWSISPSSIDHGVVNTYELILTSTGDEELILDLTYVADDFSEEIEVNFSVEQVTLSTYGQEETITVTVLAFEDQYISLGGTKFGGTIHLSEAGVEQTSLDLSVSVYSPLIDFTNPDISSSDEKPNPGDSIEFDVKIENTFSYDMEDILMKSWLENIDDGSDLWYETEEFDLDYSGDDDRTKGFEFDIPYNIDEDKFDMKLRVEGTYEDSNEDDQSFTIYAYYKNFIDVEKENDQEVFFEDIESSILNPTCGSTFTLSTDVINIGKKDLDEVNVVLKITSLGLEYTSAIFDLDESTYDSRKESLQFLVTLPEGLIADSYTVEFEAYEDGDIFDSQTYTLGVTSCTDESDDTSGDDDDTSGDGNETVYYPTGFSIAEWFNSDNAKLSFWIIGDLALLAVAIYFISLIFRKRK